MNSTFNTNSMPPGFPDHGGCSGVFPVIFVLYLNFTLLKYYHQNHQFHLDNNYTNFLMS